MSRKNANKQTRSRRVDTDEFKQEAVQMLLDGHSAASVCERLGLSGTNRLSRWKRQTLQGEGGIASNLETRCRELEAELRRVERERDILTALLAHFRSTALFIFSRSGSPTCTRPSISWCRETVWQ